MGILQAVHAMHPVKSSEPDGLNLSQSCVLPKILRHYWWICVYGMFAFVKHKISSPADGR